MLGEMLKGQDYALMGQNVKGGGDRRGGWGVNKCMASFLAKRRMAEERREEKEDEVATDKFDIVVTVIEFVTRSLLLLILLLPLLLLHFHSFLLFIFPSFFYYYCICYCCCHCRYEG